MLKSEILAKIPPKILLFKEEKTFPDFKQRKAVNKKASIWLA